MKRVSDRFSDLFSRFSNRFSYRFKSFSGAVSFCRHAALTLSAFSTFRVRIFRVLRVFAGWNLLRDSPQTLVFLGERDLPQFPHFPCIGFESLISKNPTTRPQVTGILLYCFLGDCAGDVPGEFIWAFFLPQDLGKNPATKPSNSKINFCKQSILPKADPNIVLNCRRDCSEFLQEEAHWSIFHHTTHRNWKHSF